ncbi:MAG: hypothetical protein CSA96_09430, partial [Bacteroidetes bacterium]
MKMRILNTPKSVLFAFGLLLYPASLLIAQQEEVRVVKPYSPTLSAAEKIQLLPSLDEDISYETPVFEYTLFPKRYDSEFRVEPIKAAKMVKMPLKRLYKSQLTLGMGNYLTPLAELRINQLRSRKGTFGLALRHHSMNGKLKLDNERRVDAGFSESSARLYGSRFLKKAAFEYEAGAAYHTYLHYGLNPALDTLLERKQLLEPYFLAEGRLNLHSTHADSFHFNYKADLAYHYFTHRFSETEHGAKLGFEFDKRLRVIDLAAELGGAYYGHFPDWDTTLGSQVLVWLKPQIAKGNGEWRFTAGFNVYADAVDQLTSFHFYPRASFQFNVVRKVLVPYFGVDGFLESSNYRKTVEENPYVVPTLALRPVSHKLIAYAGLKGRFSDALAYNLKADYSIIDDQYFFVNDSSTVLGNQFMVVYDDITLLRLHGEFSVRPSDSWKIFLKGNYYQYTLVREDHPWNKPSFDIRFQARYNMADKFLIDAGVYAIGARYYQNFNPLLEERLPFVIDGNLAVEYRYSKLLSFFVRFNNLAAGKYYLYNQYPAFRFRAILG